MNYYDTFVNTAQVGRESFDEHMQEVVNALFDNASTAYKDIEEEIEFGTLEFKQIDARINGIIDAKTGQRVNDDFKKIIFRDINYKPELGTRYRFDDNIWIVFSAENHHTDTSSVYIRRCNHTLNLQTPLGTIHQEPCCIGYELVETPPFMKYSVEVPMARSDIFLQYNEHTKGLNINSRFIIGGDAYKVRTNNKMDKRNTYDKNSVRTISFFLDYDEINAYDNLELEIADYKEYQHTLKIQLPEKMTVGLTDELSYSLVINDEDAQAEMIWETSNPDVISVDLEAGTYTAIAEGVCTLTCSMAENNLVRNTLVIMVSNEVVNVVHNVIAPQTTYIKQNGYCTYSVYEYINGEPTETSFTITADGVPNSYYHFVKDDNHFSVVNLKTYDMPLEVTCVNNNDDSQVTIEIELGGLF